MFLFCSWSELLMSATVMESKTVIVQVRQFQPLREMLDKLCPRSWLVQLNSTWEGLLGPLRDAEIESLENGTRLPLHLSAPSWLPERSSPSSHGPRVISSAHCPRDSITQNRSFLILSSLSSRIPYVLGIFVVAGQVIASRRIAEWCVVRWGAKLSERMGSKTRTVFLPAWAKPLSSCVLGWLHGLFLCLKFANMPKYLVEVMLQTAPGWAVAKELPWLFSNRRNILLWFLISRADLEEDILQSGTHLAFDI